MVSISYPQSSTTNTKDEQLPASGVEYSSAKERMKI